MLVQMGFLSRLDTVDHLMIDIGKQAYIELTEKHNNHYSF